MMTGTSVIQVDPVPKKLRKVKGFTVREELEKAKREDGEADNEEPHDQQHNEEENKYDQHGNEVYPKSIISLSESSINNNQV